MSSYCTRLQPGTMTTAPSACIANPTHQSTILPITIHFQTSRYGTKSGSSKKGYSQSSRMVESRDNVWSFQTRYPRQKKFDRSGKGGKGRKPQRWDGRGSKGKKDGNRISGLVLPNRLRLADMRKGDRWHVPQQQPPPEKMKERRDAPSYRKPKEADTGRRDSTVPRGDRKEERFNRDQKTPSGHPVKGSAAKPRRAEGLSRKERRQKRSIKNDPAILSLERSLDKSFEKTHVERSHAEKINRLQLVLSPSLKANLRSQISKVSFGTMGLRPEIVDGLKNVFGPTCKPTPVQALAIPASLDPERNGKVLVVGAETGSGKTMAYLIPILQRLRDAESRENEEFAQISSDMAGIVEAVVTQKWPNMEKGEATEPALPTPIFSSKIRIPGRPRALILVPTRDLVEQVTRVAKSICAHHARLVVVGVHGRIEHESSAVEKLRSKTVDIVVATPFAAARLWEEKGVSPDSIIDVVVDEADTILDESFEPELKRCMEPIWARLKKETEESSSEQTRGRKRATKKAAALKPEIPSYPHISYVSATFPQIMTVKLAKLHPDHKIVATPLMHCTNPTLRQTFVKLTKSDTRPNILLNAIKQSAVTNERRVLVFCNRRESAEWVYDFLRGKKYNVHLLTAEMSSEERQRILSPFIGARDGRTAVKKSGGGCNVNGEAHEISTISTVTNNPDAFAILVATDAVSRGLDMVAVDHVVNFEMPVTSVDYLHRVGRTARNGMGGRVTSIVVKRDKELAKRLHTAHKNRTMVPG
ncbi:hypothetical protein HDU96_000318 [Phlyctochytrium bullatum]|nr:hypothetical protein HDU96_000318 [Phlyctochytrium bullatum]